MEDWYAFVSLIREVSGSFTDCGATEKRCMPVIFANGEERIVPAYMLDYLIREKKIVAFFRSEGWVQVDRDPIRKSQLPLMKTGERWSDFMFKLTEH